MTPNERKDYRNEHMKPIFGRFKEWLDTSIDLTPASLNTGKAMKYLNGQWPKLLHIFEDGRISLDTNFIENKIRPFTVGRKNWMFSDTQAGAKASAMIYSILETAKANNVEPSAYLSHVLEKIPSAQSAEDFEALLPQNFSEQKTN